MQKLKNIEFLRIIGCLTIIVFHLFFATRSNGYFADIEIFRQIAKMTVNGQKAVDLFFMLSGLFFALKLDTTKTIFEFIKNKLIRVYPVLVFITIIYLFTSLLGITKFTLYDNILSLLCLNGTGLVLSHGNTGIFWYVSAMLWTFLLFYYLLKNYDKKHVNLFIALLIFFCYSFIIHAKGGKINSHYQTFYNIFNVGMMRAFGGIGIGYFIAEWYKNNREAILNLKISLLNKYLITITELSCISFIIITLMFTRVSYKNQIIFIAIFAITIILFLLKKGFITNWLNKDIWVILSKYTYSLYMTHSIIFKILKGTLWKTYPNFVVLHPFFNISLALISTLILGMLTYHFIEKPCTTWLKGPKKENI